MLSIVLIVLLVLALLGAIPGTARYGAVSWSPFAVVAVVILLAILFGWLG